MKRNWILFLLIATPLAASPEETMTLTLPQAVELAVAQNIDLKMAQDDLKTFQSQYWEAVGTAIGDFRGTLSYTRNVKKQAFFLAETDPATGATSIQKITVGADNAYTAGVSFDQPLFSGGKVFTAIRAGKKQMTAGEEAVRGTREEVVFATKQIFYAYLLANSNVGIADDNLKLADDHLKTIRERFRQGLDSDLTVLRQEVEVASARTALIRARNTEDLSVTNLQKVLYLDVEKPLKPVGTLTPPGDDLPTYEAVIGAALRNNASLSVAEKQTDVARDYIRIVRAEHFPSLKGFAEYNWLAQSDDFALGGTEQNDSFGAGVKLEWNLFSGGETRQRVVQAKIGLDRARNRQTKIEREVRVAVKQEWLNVLEARERAKSQETAVGQAKRALEATEVRFKLGRASQLEQNDATFALNRARIILAQASHDYWVARAGLEKAMGTTLEEVR